MFSYEPVEIVSNPSIVAKNFGSDNLELVDFYWSEDEWEGCIIECLRYTKLYPESPLLFYAWYRGGMALRAAGRPNKSVFWLRRSLIYNPPPLVRPYIRFQTAVSVFHSGSYDIAELEFYRLASTLDTTLLAENAALMQSVVAAKQNHWDKVVESLCRAAPIFVCDSLGKATYQEIGNLANKIAQRPSVRSPILADRLSAFLPGLGQVYSRDLFGEILSMT